MKKICCQKMLRLWISYLYWRKATLEKILMSNHYANEPFSTRWWSERYSIRFCGKEGNQGCNCAAQKSSYKIVINASNDTIEKAFNRINHEHLNINIITKYNTVDTDLQLIKKNLHWNRRANVKLGSRLQIKLWRNLKLRNVGLKDQWPQN